MYMWRDVIRRATARVRLICYTFDLPLIRDALRQSASDGRQVQVVADRGQAYSHRTREMHEMLTSLVEAGVEVTTRSGSHGGFGGLCRTKLLITDTEAVIGSCNFTGTSQSNFEVSALLSVKNARPFDEAFQLARTTASDFVRNAVHGAPQ